MSLIAAVAGSAILKTLAPIILKAGAPILADLVRSNVGDTAGKVVDAIAGQLGVAPTPEAIVARHLEDPEATAAAIRKTEADFPEYWSMLAQADAIRGDLLKAEMKEPLWAWAWRPFWMWLLAGFWVWTAVAVALGLGHIDFGTLIWLTTAYLALYMGGHTLKDAVTKITGAAPTEGGK